MHNRYLSAMCSKPHPRDAPKRCLRQSMTVVIEQVQDTVRSRILPPDPALDLGLLDEVLAVP